MEQLELIDIENEFSYLIVIFFCFEKQLLQLLLL